MPYSQFAEFQAAIIVTTHPSAVRVAQNPFRTRVIGIGLWGQGCGLEAAVLGLGIGYGVSDTVRGRATAFAIHGLSLV